MCYGLQVLWCRGSCFSMQLLPHPKVCTWIHAGLCCCPAYVCQGFIVPCCVCTFLGSSWSVMAHGDARSGKCRGNWRMEWVASTLHTASEHCISSITTADAHTSAASSRPNWRPRRFKLTRPFRRNTKSGFCACTITFQTQSTFECLHFVYFKRQTIFVAMCTVNWQKQVIVLADVKLVVESLHISW
jgi:hypothetical protein